MEEMLRDFWQSTLKPFLGKIKDLVKRKFREKPEESFAVAVGSGTITMLWLGGYIITSAIMGAIGFTVGLLVLTKYLPIKVRKFIGNSKFILALIDIGAGLLAFLVISGVTGLFTGIFSTVLVTATLGLLAKQWRTSPESGNEPEPVMI